MRASNHHHHHHHHHNHNHQQHITNTCHQDARKSSLTGSSDNDGACEDRQQHQILHHHHQHQHLLLEAKRSSGDNKEAIDDNIKKHNTNNNYHNHHHHHHNYYNTHNFHQNFHHQQQQLNKHPHLHFQPAQTTQTTNTNATTTNQTAQPQQQPHVMAHYKFHNDCQSSVLTYEQVKRLDFVMDQVVPIHGRGNAPTLYVKLKELIRLVKFKLQNEHSIEIRDVRLNGGAASYVLAPENSHYNDLDLVFGIDLTSEDRFDVIRDVVLECLMEFYPKVDECVSQQQQPSQQSQKQHNDEQSLVVGLSAMSNDDNHYTTHDAGTTSDESESQSSRSQRSSSFESDNMMINLTTNEDDESGEEEEDDDDEGDIIVRIDSDEAYEKKNEKDNQQQQGDNIQENQDRQSNSIEEMINSSETTKLDTPREVEANGVIITSPSEEVYDKFDATQQQQQVVYHQYAGQMPPISCATKEAYVHKMVKVNDDDRWSLISLGVQQSETNYNHLNHHHNGQQLSDCVQVGGVGYPAGELNDNLKCCNGVTTTYQQQQQQQQQQHQQQPKQQSPNSIELKFVDRMRRKFEFSVDSFQIILDSLIQFYDYAPQSTITIQRKASPCCCQQQATTATNTSARHVCNVGAGYCTGGGFSHISHPTRRIHQSATPADNNNHVCVDHISTKASHRSHQPGNHNNNNKTQVIVNNFLDNEKEHIRHNNNHHHHHHHHRHHKDCKAVLSGSASYYELSLDPSNSLSNSSVASSSGCSSSSSVVSSSSSSLSSCDEDHEDLLYNDVDSSSPSSSSSASTSSLLSSTTVSITSSSSTSATKHGTKNCDHQDHQQLARTRVCDDDDDDEDDDNDDDDDDESVKVHENRRKSTTTTTKVARSSVVDCSKCFQKLHLNTADKQQNKSQADLYGRKNPSSCDLGRGASKLSSCAVISENFYPTVIGRSEYGNFKEALYHLEKKLIATRSPEEIRGGGLLKYCNLLVKQYKPTNVYQIRTLERYMCSRFFIDFSDLNQQRAKLESYLANHFSDDTMQKFDYLTILHNVVQRSTVCLMNHELRLTLNMIRELAYELNEQQQQQQHQGQSQPLHLAQRVAQQPIFSQATRQQQQQQQQQQQHDQHQYQQQQKPIMLQSGVYRVKLVNYALAKPAKS